MSRDSNTTHINLFLLSFENVNAADYLKKNGLDKEEIREIINQKDRYTNETLLYQYRDDEAMTEYIAQMIEQV